MNAFCVNDKCSERELAKSLDGLDPVPPLIRCGECGRPCDIRDGEATEQRA